MCHLGSNLPLLLFITLSTLYRYHPRCFAIILASQDLTILLMNAGGMGFKFYLEITVATLYCCTARQHWAIFHRHGLRVFFLACSTCLYYKYLVFIEYISEQAWACQQHCILLVYKVVN